MAENSLAAVPQLCTMPRPTVAIMAMLSFTEIEPAPSTSASSSFRTSSLWGSSASLLTTTHMESIPVGICSKEIPYPSSTLSTFRPKPTSLFIMFFSTEMTLYPLWPAMPVMVGTETSFGGFLLIRVPG